MCQYGSYMVINKLFSQIFLQNKPTKYVQIIIKRQLGLYAQHTQIEWEWDAHSIYTN